MKPLFIAGNWKSNKTTTEAGEWLRKLSAVSSQLSVKNLTLVICAPFTLLHFLHEQIKEKQLPIMLGAQDVSAFGEGAYTGEVNAKQIKELADWVIVGHSERRKYFSETDELLKQKVGQAKAAGLKIIYCVPDDQTPVPAGVDVVAYEPVWAIGTGKADTPENAGTVIASLKQKFSVPAVLYGGSVIPDNVGSFVLHSAIDGVLLGGASLGADTFFSLIAAVQSVS